MGDRFVGDYLTIALADGSFEGKPLPKGKSRTPGTYT
jgi:hypothetical protein